MGRRWLLLLPLLATTALAGCAASPHRPEPEVRRRIQSKREFPDFVALVARPGDTFSSLAAEHMGDASLSWFVAEFNGIDTLAPGSALVIPRKAPNPGGLIPGGFQTVPVLVYHKFSRSAADLMTVRESDFEAQMRFLKEKGYHVIPMDRFFGFLNYRHPVPRKSVVITIDDGWRSAYDIAFPILRKYGYPATLFLYTDFAITSSTTLGWNLLAEMEKGSIDVQCHTKTHRNLDVSKGKESFRDYFESMKTELVEPARAIGIHLNKKVAYLAYPYGETNNLVVALMEKTGYRGGFTVERGGNPFFADRFRIRRSMIYGTFTLREFESNLATFSEEEPGEARVPGPRITKESPSWASQGHP
ncbi:MAG: Polysaccharide deacetylase [Deltaproteobacteria bacterium]|nr:Polysaccharide deacetylase [Deltaproteobacteria bacterium]MBS1243836.1 Polysaccharide deacetylase [Deltaproteobacteria bacterium]